MKKNENRTFRFSSLKNAMDDFFQSFLGVISSYELCGNWFT